MKLPASLIMLFILLNYCHNAFATAAVKEWQVTQLPVKASLRSSAATKHSLWVAGSQNRVYISKNNGKNWSDISPELNEQHDFRDIAVLNENTAIVMSAGEGNKSKLFITKDQGKSWQLLRTNPDQQGFYDSIAFVDQQTGFLLGDPVGGHFVIERTRDQGKSWQRIKAETLPAISDNEVAFAASGNTLIASAQDVWFTTGGLSAFVYHSADFAKTGKKVRCRYIRQQKPPALMRWPLINNSKYLPLVATTSNATVFITISRH